MTNRTRAITGCAAFALILAACRSPIYDDFGVAGYAQLQGVAQMADGTPIGTVFVSCGLEANSFAGLRTTDSTGRFDVTLVAPGPTVMPADSILRCRLRAPGDAPALVTVTTDVRFTPDRASRQTTVVALIAE